MYYNLDLAWEPKIIGVRNGIYQVELDKKAYDKKTYAILDSLFISSKFTAKQEYPEMDFKFYFKKLKSAKKTSFMSFTPNLKHGYFLVHKKTLQLLETFNIQYHKNFEAVIYDSPDENLDENYRLFYSVLLDWDVIDFENTVFVSGGYGNVPITEHQFIDSAEFYNFNGISKVKKLALNSKFDSSLDLFITRLGGILVSGRLKLALEENNVTGITFNSKVEVSI